MSTHEAGPHALPQPSPLPSPTQPRLPMWRILEMNLGFLGLQFSFGLQQANMGPIYSYLGASEGELPVLTLAGPITGLLVQPLVGALSDRTAGRFGRRTPYFVLGAVICAVCLFFMPLSASLLMAVSLLWILDAGNNITMEPYRAYVADRLSPSQRQVGYLSQSAFTGLAQMLAFLAPSMLVVWGVNQNAVDAHGIPLTARLAFWTGAVLSLVTIGWSILRVPELPLTPAQRSEIAARRRGFLAVLREIGHAIATMPRAMRQLGLMALFQWSAMWGYWTYSAYVLAHNIYGTGDPASAGFRSAVLLNGEMMAFGNAVAVLAAFAMVPLSRKLGPGTLHAACLAAGGAGMLSLPLAGEPGMAFLPAIGVGLAWGSIMGNPHTILAGVVPPQHVGVYMGIFNMMIVIPMMLFAMAVGQLDLGFVRIGLGLFEKALGSDPSRMVSVCGLGMMVAAAAVLAIREGRAPRRASGA